MQIIKVGGDMGGEHGNLSFLCISRGPGRVDEHVRHTESVCGFGKLMPHPMMLVSTTHPPSNSPGFESIY